jgi:hypothetical protein
MPMTCKFVLFLFQDSEEIAQIATEALAHLFKPLQLLRGILIVQEKAVVQLKAVVGCIVDQIQE